MYVELYQYFLLHKKLTVPGIGTFLLQRQAAVSDFLNRRINAPIYSISFQNDTEALPAHLNYWLASRLGTTEGQADQQLTAFAAEMKQYLDNGASIEWNGMGKLSKGLAGNVKFIPSEHPVLEGPVKAEKVIREKAEHMVRVGENQKSSGEMTVLLHKTEAHRSLWWVYALAVGVLAFLFIAVYISQKGVDISSAANTIKLTPADTQPALSTK